MACSSPSGTTVHSGNGGRRRLLDSRDWLITLVIAPLVTVNAILVFGEVSAIVRGNDSLDWHTFAQASHRFFEGNLYADGPLYSYRYSPVLAPFLRPLEWIGQEGWRVVHLVAVLALPSWPLRLAVLVSWPFWFDVNAGGVAIFALVLAWYAIEGRGWAMVSYLVMVLLIPKPLFVPVAAWLLWKQPHVRVPFTVALLATAGVVYATGWGSEWVARLALAADDLTNAINYGPSRILGIAAVATQVPLAIWLTWRGRLGLASLAAAPYWLPYYFIVVTLEASPWLPRTNATQLP